MLKVLLVATLDTKAEEAAYLAAALDQRGLAVSTVDISLLHGGAVLSGAMKIERMADMAQQASAQVAAGIRAGAVAVIGIGGGTGGDVILRIMQQQPVDFPQVLVTTLPFDPRAALAKASIILVPTLADMSGLNGHLRLVLDRSAALLAGLVDVPKTSSTSGGVAITVLGATQAGVDHLTSALRVNGQASGQARAQASGQECTHFHANGYGGAAFARLVRSGRFRAVVDFTPHELTRQMIAGVQVEMPDRFTVAGELGLPLVILPGGLNFIGLGALEQIPDHYRARPHYPHSAFFTHVKVSADEMRALARALAQKLSTARGPTIMLVPMGGFSHEDAPGGAIEDMELRAVFLHEMQTHLSSRVTLHALPSHINHPDTAQRIMAELAPFLTDQERT